MMKDCVEANPGCDGIVLGGHGLFTWGDTHRESYLNTITIIDQLGQFVNEHVERKGDKIFGGAQFKSREDRASLSLEVLPYLARAGEQATGASSPATPTCRKCSSS